MVTTLEYRKQKLQVQNALAEWRQVRQQCLRQKKEIRQKTGKKEIGTFKLSSRKSVKYYIRKWSEEKTEYEQINNEERAYKKYQMIFHKEIAEERDEYWYIQNQLNLLSLKKKQYRSEQKKKILALCRDYDSCGAGLQRKRKELPCKAGVRIDAAAKRKGKGISYSVPGTENGDPEAEIRRGSPAVRKREKIYPAGIWLTAVNG